MISTVQGDINEFIPQKSMSSTPVGEIQYIELENRSRQFERFKAKTRTGGLNVFFAFVFYPNVEPAPDAGDNDHPLGREERQSYYEG